MLMAVRIKAHKFEVESKKYSTATQTFDKRFQKSDKQTFIRYLWLPVRQYCHTISSPCKSPFDVIFGNNKCICMPKIVIYPCLRKAEKYSSALLFVWIGLSDEVNPLSYVGHFIEKGINMQVELWESVNPMWRCRTKSNFGVRFPPKNMQTSSHFILQMY